MIRVRAGRWLLAFVMTVPCVASAVDSASPVISPVVTLAKLAAALLIVLTVFWVFAKVMRHAHGLSANAHSALKVVGSLSLGQRERVVVIQAGDEQIVLGVTASQINMLHVLPEPLQVNSTAGSTSFKERMNAALNRQQAER